MLPLPLVPCLPPHVFSGRCEIPNHTKLSLQISEGSLLASASLTNPVLGLALGILATSLVQSSSATTSLVVAMVASRTITVEQGIPVIMGTNIGTSLTSTFIALYHIKQKEQYRLGFSAAILHDLFNWMTVIVLLPVEMLFGFLEKSSEFIVGSIFNGTAPTSTNPLSFMDDIMEPIVNSIVILQPPSLKKCFMAMNTAKDWGMSGEMQSSEEDSSEEDTSEEDDSLEEELMSEGFIKQRVVLGGSLEEDSSEENSTEIMFERTADMKCSILETDCEGACSYLFAGTYLNDEVVGGIIFLFTIVIFMSSFVLMVRGFQLILDPKNRTRKTCLERDIPYIPFISDLTFMFCGFAFTIIIQSSSAVTSALVPLVSLTNFIL